MILYTNGDSNTAGAELANDFAFAEDDPKYKDLGREPHPDNLPLSYGAIIANKLQWEFKCDAESASSNERIMRTTVEYLNTNPDDPFILIGWAGWDREEWEIDGQKYQVTASGEDHLPFEYKDRYRAWVVNQTLDERRTKSIAWHTRIYELHQQLKQNNIKHLFFNTYDYMDDTTELDWGNNYHHPYNGLHTFHNSLCLDGFLSNQNYHHGVPAHQHWAGIMLDIIKEM